MRKLFVPLGLSFVLLGCLTLLYFLSQSDFMQLFTSLTQEKTAMAYAALPNNQAVLGASITAKDGRVENLKNFLLKYHSLLGDYVDNIVTDADLYGIDYRLLPAIAMHESGGCKIIPLDSNNCWGFGVYGGHARKFANYPEAIDTVTKALAEHYVAKGRATPEDIMPIWDPASPGTWAKGVRFFMDQM